MYINFEFDTEYGPYRDSLLLPDDHNYTEIELEDMKLQRLNSWIAIITTPSEEI